MTLREVAERLECRLEGDGAIEIAGVAAIEDAGPADLTFFANPRYAAELRTTRAAAVIAAPKVDGVPCAVLRTPDPYIAFARAVALFADTWRAAPGVHATAIVEPGATVAADASIGPFTLVAEGARIGARTIVHSHVAVGRGASVGEDCTVHSHVALRERVTIGNRVVLQNGVVIGADGFGFARRPDGSHHKIPQVGAVVLEDDVEIGANTTIDRPAVGETRTCM